MINPFRRWGEQSRPLPENVNWVTEYKPGKYDLAILHVDQQCFGRVSKGILYREMNEIITDIPKVVINHMTPFHDTMEPHEVIDEMKELVGDNFMVVNSYRAAQQWGWGYPVIHGMEVDEWWDLPKEPRAVAVLSPAGMEKAYRRQLLRTTSSLLKEKGIDFIWVGVDYKCKTFDEYRNFLGRSLIFFNPTWNSPMPRARTEAMLSGCCVITTKHHGASDFIETGENGFLIPDNPHEASKLIERLLTEGYQEALDIGQKGKETARHLFNSDKFAEQWLEVLDQVGIKL